ncbi:MAG: NADH-quinone oxidoreductase subunit C [Rhodocyclaceae bacterium]|jgi:NADH-quinone oxidoreductase subunit C|nr:NADH-quinone oxidoreductase subunit C [Rhodocyclaceae bacterium]
MSTRLERLCQALRNVLGDEVQPTVSVGQVAIEVSASRYRAVAELLRDEPSLGFEQLIDLSGLDYSTYGNGGWEGKRFAVAVQLLSVANNWRLRLKVFADDEGFPVLDSVCGIWPSVNWYEREAFDLYGIMFAGHPDLRRILTDYGFVGHPFRKDFPISGYVEMRYSPEEGRVVYQPVTIEPREITPRIVREENYGGAANG